MYYLKTFRNKIVLKNMLLTNRDKGFFYFYLFFQLNYQSLVTLPLSFGWLRRATTERQTWYPYLKFWFLLRISTCVIYELSTLNILKMYSKCSSSWNHKQPIDLISSCKTLRNFKIYGIGFIKEMISQV